MADQKAPQMQATLGLTGLTSNAMALIAPGAFLWLTFFIQATTGVAGQPSTAPAMWIGIFAALLLCLATAVAYAEISKLYPGTGSSYYYAEQAMLSQKNAFKYARIAKFIVGWGSHLYYWIYPGVMVAVMGVLVGYRMTLADPERYSSFVGGMAQGRTPASSPRELREVLYGGGGGPLSVLASYLFTHNAKIGMLCFAVGFLAGVPVIYLLFSNGLALGAMAALYQSRGLGGEFWAWVLPHGVTELSAVCLCGAAGMAIGTALVFPGRHTRLRNLALRGREVAVLALGAVVMFLVAGLIEGFFRQLVQDFAQHAVLSAQCVHQFPTTLAAGQVVSQALRLVSRQFSVHEDGAHLLRITFHDYLLPWVSFRRSSCLARNINAAT